jgi:hypothetical protein
MHMARGLDDLTKFAEDAAPRIHLARGQQHTCTSSTMNMTPCLSAIWRSSRKKCGEADMSPPSARIGSTICRHRSIYMCPCTCMCARVHFLISGRPSLIARVNFTICILVCARIHQYCSSIMESCVCIYIYIYIYIYMYTYIYTNTCRYAQTYKNTHIPNIGQNMHVHTHACSTRMHMSMH